MAIVNGIEIEVGMKVQGTYFGDSFTGTVENIWYFNDRFGREGNDNIFIRLDAPTKLYGIVREMISFTPASGTVEPVVESAPEPAVQQMPVSEYHDQYEMAVFIDRECRNEILSTVEDGNGFVVGTFGGSVFHVAAGHPVYFPAHVDPSEWRMESEEVLATASASLAYRMEPVAAFVAPKATAKPVGFASGKMGKIFEYRAPNLRAGAKCRFEARNGFEGVGYIVRVIGDAVTIRYRNAQGNVTVEDVPAYRVWPYGGIQRGPKMTTWGAREKEIRDRAFEKGSDD